MHDEHLNNMVIRPASLEDSDFVFLLRTRTEDAKYYFTGSKIQKDTHEWFWLKNLKSYYIIEVDGLRVGFFGIVNSDFRFAVMPEYRGKGLGKLIVSYAYTNLGVRQVRVSADNQASIKCFSSNGFTVVRESSGACSGRYLVLESVEDI